MGYTLAPSVESMNRFRHRNGAGEWGATCIHLLGSSELDSRRASWKQPAADWHFSEGSY